MNKEKSISEMIADIIAAVDKSDEHDIRLSGIALELDNGEYLDYAIAVGTPMYSKEYIVYSGDFFSAKLSMLTDESVVLLWEDIFIKHNNEC